MDTTSVKKPRKSRYQRRKNPPAFDITKNVLDILEVAARFPVLRTHGFYDLLPHRSKTRLRLMLSYLHDVGFLGRYRDEHPTPFLACEYYITSKGLDKLIEFGREVKPSMLEHRPKPGEQRRLHTHSMMLSDGISSMAAGAGERFIPRVEILEGVTHPDPLRFAVRITYTFPNGKTETYTKSIKADELTGLRNHDKNRYFVWETENTSPLTRSTLSGSSWLRKFLCWVYVIGEVRSYFEQLGVDNLRVLVTAPTMERLQHKIDLVERIAGKSTIFLFQVVPIGGRVEDLYHTPWLRAGLPSIRLDTNEVVE